MMAIPLPTDDDLARVSRVCAGDLDPRGASPVQMRAVARALPELAERAWFDTGAERVALAHAITGTIWPAVSAMRTMPTIIPWTAMAAGALEALSILRHPSPPDLDGAAREIARDRQTLRRPGIYALLHGTTAGRVMRRPSRSHVDHEGEDGICQDLARTLFGVGEMQWTLDVPAHGRSRMAGYLLRTAAEIYPEAFRPFEPIGVTGELDAGGNVIAVNEDGIPDKVGQFFRQYPGGTCLLPAANLAHRATGRSKHDPGGDALRTFPVRHLIELLIRFGVVLPDNELTAFFEDVRAAAARRVVDWRHQERAVTDLVELSLEVEATKTLADWPRLVAEARHSSSPPRLVLQGPPGAGKSLLLRRLHADLSGGELRLDGPSVFVRAKDMPDRDALATAVSLELQRRLGTSRWSLDQINRFLDPTASPTARSTWLLIDGVDEVNASGRVRVIEVARNWPGPVCLATRRVREEIPHASLVNVPALSATQVEHVLALEGRTDLAGPLVPSRYQPPTQGAAAGVRRELTRTPLGVSLLAAAVGTAAELEGLTRFGLLERGIVTLLRRAVRERELDEHAVNAYHLGGNMAVGALAWRMLTSGAQEFSLHDMREAAHSLGLGASELATLLHTIEAAGVVQPSGAECWEFAIRSFAEYCAARYLMGAPEGLGELETQLSCLGEPSINETVIHVAVSAEPEPVLALLLRAREQPITALDVASAILLEAEPSRIGETTVIEVLRRRLALETRLEQDDERNSLPLSFGRTEAILARYRGVATRHVEELIDASHPGVRTLLCGSPLTLHPTEHHCPIHDRPVKPGADLDLIPSRAQLLIKTFADLARRTPPPRSRLFLGYPWDGVKEVSKRDPVRALGVLAGLLHDPVDSVRHAALEEWLGLADDRELLQYLPELMTLPDWDAAEVLRHVAAHRGVSIRREAILRYVLHFGFTPSNCRLSQIVAEVRADTKASRPFSVAVEEAWNAAWECGALGWIHDDAVSSLTDRVPDEWRERPHVYESLLFAYAHMLDDPRAEARLRSLIVWHEIKRDRTRRLERWVGPWTHEHLGKIAIPLLADSALAIRVWALARLCDLKSPSGRDLPRECLNADDNLELWLAWRFVIGRDGARFDPEALVDALCPRREKPRSTAPSSSTNPDWPTWYALPMTADAARGELLDAAADVCASVEVIEKIKATLHEPHRRKAAQELLRHVALECYRRRDAGGDTAKSSTTDEVLALLKPYLPRRWQLAPENYDDFDEPYGEPYDDDNYAEVERLLDYIRDSDDRAKARDELLVMVLEGKEKAWPAQEALERSGGLKPRHQVPIAEHLLQHPGCVDAIALFLKTGATEADLVWLWEKSGVPWLPQPSKRARTRRWPPPTARRGGGGP